MLKRKKKSEKLKERVISQLKTIYDPEIPVNIYDLGLVYDVNVEGDSCTIQMTLTSPGCPVAQTFPGTVEQSVLLLAEINECLVELVWDPPWTKDRMSEVARLELGIFD